MSVCFEKEKQRGTEGVILAARGGDTGGAYLESRVTTQTECELEEFQLVQAHQPVCIRHGASVSSTDHLFARVVRITARIVLELYEGAALFSGTCPGVVPMNCFIHRGEAQRVEVKLI